MKKRAGPHRREELLADEALRLGLQGHVHADDVGRGGDLERRVLARDAELGRALGRQAAAPGHDGHAEGAPARDHLGADPADADQSERAAEEPLRLAVLLLVPDAEGEVAGVAEDLPVEREDQSEGQLGDRNRVLAGAVGDVDAARGRRLDVDRVVAGAGPDDEREVPGLEHRFGHLRAAHDENVGARFPDRLDEGLVLGVRLVEDLAPEVLQPLPAGIFELVGDQDFHN